MNIKHPLARLLSACAATGLLTAPVAPALAQTATPPTPAPAVTADAVDPPARVGRLAALTGTVSFHTADAEQWSAATLNYPVASGDAFWTQPQSTARIEVSASAITLNEATELDVAQLLPTGLAATEPQGEVFLRLSHLANGETETITTPRGVVTLAADGLYDVGAGDTQTPTLVTVIQGVAQVTGTGLSLQVQPGQTATVTGTGNTGDPLHGTIGPAVHNAFLDAQLAAQAAIVATADAVPQACATMPGAADLSSHGSWKPTPQYGTVWYPQVAADWVPYRDGHWAYVAPWGWTWVDDEPWGFAPFHYGRWVEVDDRWGWAPVYAGDGGYGVDQYSDPVYAPALVTFLGAGVGFAAGLAIGAAIGGNIGWAPLGWGQPYRPWYGGSDGYFRDINRFNVSRTTNFTSIRNQNVTIDNFNGRGATIVPASAVIGSQRIAGQARPFSAAQVAGLRPLAGPSFGPGPTTAGLTPGVAQRLGVARPELAGRVSPGPAFTAHPGAVGAAALGAGAVGAAALGAVALRPHGAIGQVPPQAARVAGEGAPALRGATAGTGAPALAARPGGLPGLRTPAEEAHPAALATRPRAVGGSAAGAVPERETTAPRANPAAPRVVTPGQSEVPTRTTGPEAAHAAVPQASHAAVPQASHAGVPQVSHAAVPQGSRAAVPQVSHAAVPQVSHAAVPQASRAAVPQAARVATPQRAASPTVQRPTFNAVARPAAVARPTFHPAPAAPRPVFQPPPQRPAFHPPPAAPRPAPVARPAPAARPACIRQPCR